MFSGIEINIVGNILVLILLFIASIAITLFVYKKTNPPVSSGLHRLLVILRTLSLTLIIFILFEPILNLTWNRVQKPIIAFLVDTSSSMNLNDSQGLREEKAKQVLSDLQTLVDKKGYLSEQFQFSDRIEPISDSLTFDNEGTDISKALVQLKEQMSQKYLTSVVLITDGNYNIGENPSHIVETYGVPVFPVSIGDPNPQMDVMISQVITNQITYTNNEVPVDVIIRASGYKSKKIAISLQLNNEEQDSKYVELTDDAMETKVRLHFTPKTSGYHKYIVRIPSIAGELTEKNNKKNFYVKVLKSKMKLLVIAGSPGFDYLFIKRILEADKNIEITHWIQKNNNRFYESPFADNSDKMKSFDCVLLINFPHRKYPGNVLQSITELIKNNNTPLLILNSRDLYFHALHSIQPYLPVNTRIMKSNEKLVSFNLTRNGINHPLMRLSDNEIENQNKWSELPPIYYSSRDIKKTPGSINLLEVDMLQSKIFATEQNLPIVLAKKTGEQKTVVILGYGLWRWDFLMQGIGKSTNTFSHFITNCIRWLVTNEDSKLVRIQADKEIYRSGEKVTFTAETYYEDYRPLDGAQISVYIKNQSNEYELTLVDTDKGKYQGEFFVLDGGDYTFQGQATYRNKLLGQDSGRFSVEEFSLEYLDTKMNEALLKQIAVKSNGKYFFSQTYTAMDSILNFAEKHVEEHQQWEMWNKMWMLITIIVLLSIEWFIRKKKGML